MRFRLLRVLFTFTAFAVVWLMTSRASANISAIAFAQARMTPKQNASFAPAAPAAPAPIVPADANRAPLCDPRGAITFAAAPQMQDVEVSLDSGLTVDDCFAPKPGDARHAAPGRAPVPVDASTASTDVAAIAAVAKLARAARELLPVPAASTPCLRPGFRSTVDRPPRA